MEYGAAAKLVPNNAEMIYWHAVALVNMGRLEDSLPLFRRVFAMDKSWVTLTRRLSKVGLMPDDPIVIERIVNLEVASAPGTFSDTVPPYRLGRRCLCLLSFTWAALHQTARLHRRSAACVAWRASGCDSHAHHT